MSQKDLGFVRRSYFPTMIFQIDVPEPEDLNKKLLASIYAERERDKKDRKSVV